MWKKARAGELPETEAANRFEDLLSMGLRSVSNVVLARAALAAALATGRTVYDSTYVALAIDEACPFVTADERLVNALAGTPYGAPVVWLGAM